MTATKWGTPIALIAASVAAHFLVVGGAAVLGERMASGRPQKVKIRVTETKKPEPAPEPPKPEPPKPKPEPKPKPKKETPPTPAANKTADPPPASAEPPKPVQGLTADSFAAGGKSGFSAPVGNTTMTADEGKRLRPDQIQQLQKDLSEKARLIPESVRTPEYTPQAVDANVEGRYKVEVYVDATGKVTQAELPKKVGHGMDQRLIDAAMAARFVPRKNELGQPEAGWAEMTFHLQIP